MLWLSSHRFPAMLCATTVLIQLFQGLITQYDLYESLMQQTLSCGNACGVKSGRSNTNPEYRYRLKSSESQEFERCVIIEKERKRLPTLGSHFACKWQGQSKKRLSPPHYQRESGGAPNYLPLSDNRERVEPFQSIVQHMMSPYRSAKYSTKLPIVRWPRVRTRDKQWRLLNLWRCAHQLHF